MSRCPTCDRPTKQRWIFDPTSGDLTVNGRLVHFTPAEAQVAGHILRANGATVRPLREFDKNSHNAVLARIRKKLKPAGVVVECVPRFGYRVKP